MRDNSAAHAPDHPAMPLHESGKRVFVLVLDELIQQLAVAHTGFIGKGGSAKILDNLGKPVNRHVHHPRAESLPTSYCPAGRVFIGFFSGPVRDQGPWQPRANDAFNHLLPLHISVLTMRSGASGMCVPKQNLGTRETWHEGDWHEGDLSYCLPLSVLCASVVKFLTARYYALTTGVSGDLIVRNGWSSDGVVRHELF
jgi:hypothetical protein